LTLAEAKQLLSTLQRHLLRQQVDTFRFLSAFGDSFKSNIIQSFFTRR